MEEFKGFKVSHGVIGDEYFYGRNREMKSLERRLRNGQHSYFVANRQFGKTSLILKAVERYKKKEDISLAHVDLWGVASFEEAGKALINNYMRERFGVTEFSGRILLGVKDITAQIVKKFSGIDVETALKNFSTEAHDGGTYFLKSIQLILDIESLSKKRVVLFIDEFQELSKFKDMTVADSDVNESGRKLDPGKVLLKRLRTLLQNQSNVILFAAGSEPTLLNNLFGKTDEAFLKGALPLSVEPIVFEDYKEHFEAVCEYEDIEVPLASIQLFYYLGGGIPYYLTFFGHEYLELVSDGKIGTKEATIQAAMTVMIKNTSFFNEKINQIKNSTTNGLLFYKNLGKEHPITATAEQANISPQAVTQITAKKLIEQGFVKSIKKGNYAPILPLLYFFTINDDGRKEDLIEMSFEAALNKQDIRLP